MRYLITDLRTNEYRTFPTLDAMLDAWFALTPAQRNTGAKAVTV